MKIVRKLIAFILIPCMLIQFFGIGAQAANAVQFAEETYVNPLYADIISEEDLLQTEPVMRLAEDAEYLTSTEEASVLVREAMKQRQESIAVYFQAPEYLSAYVHEIAELALTHTGEPTEGDYLKWQYGGWNAQISYYIQNNTTYMTITYTYTYYTTDEQEEEMDDAIEALLAELNVDGQNDYAKIRAIYDYICSNIVYDYDHSADYMLKHTAYAALIDGTAVCQGYATLFYRLALELDVDNRLISGTGHGEPHGWNIVELRDLYYNVDSTWDAGADEYAYFLKGDTDFSGHVRDEELAADSFYASYPMGEAAYVPQLSSDPNICEHDYNSGVGTDPTCTEAGYVTYTCTACGNSYHGSAVPALGHSFTNYVSDHNATCTEDGTETAKCDRCTETDTRADAGSAFGHTEEAVSAQEPTCTEPGMSAGTKCAVCGVTLSAQDPVPALGHSFTNYISDNNATCTEDGTETAKCDRCTATDTRVIAKSALGHSFTNYVSDHNATCTEDGTETAKCDRCTATNTRTDAGTMLEHTGEKVPGKEAGCTETGLTDGMRCAVCGTVIEKQETIPATGHTFAGGTCSVCGYEAPAVRIYGETRYETSFAIADAMKEELGVEAFDNFIIASGTNFADALASSYLSAVKNVPIPILITNGGNAKELAEYIAENWTTRGKVYILGGTAAVPETVETVLDEYGIINTRLEGATRFDTNIEILKEAGVKDGQEILVATGYEFADSLSASAVGAPILLVNNGLGTLTDKQAEFLSGLNDVSFTIIGGTNAVSEDLKAELESYGTVQRLSGKTRYETSVLVAERYFDAPDTVVLTYGRNFPDGLCGGPLAYAMHAPLILTETNQEAAAAAYCEENNISKGIVLGGTAVLTDDSVRAVLGLPEDTEIIKG